jgi:hypothetical protein
MEVAVELLLLLSAASAGWAATAKTDRQTEATLDRWFILSSLSFRNGSRAEMHVTFVAGERLVNGVLRQLDTCWLCYCNSYAKRRGAAISAVFHLVESEALIGEPG